MEQEEEDYMPDGTDLPEVLDELDSGFWEKGSDKFSHQELVMASYQKVIDSLSNEMRAGFWEQKIDKIGNLTSVYQTDTRKHSVECIKTLLNLCVADLQGRKEKKEIDKLLVAAEELYKKHLQVQKLWWEGLTLDEKKKNKEVLSYLKLNLLHPKIPFASDFLEEKVDIYRKIFEWIEMTLADKVYFRERALVA